MYRKISIREAHALIEAHSLVWTPEIPIFQAISPKIEPLINAHPGILKNKSVLRYAETSPICY